MQKLYLSIGHFINFNIFNSQESAKVIEEEERKKGKAVQQDGTLIKSSKPQFYSWESKILQGYIKIGGIMLAVFFILGCTYEIVRYWWKIQEKAVRIQPEDGEFFI